MPEELRPSNTAIDLIGRLLIEKEYRLSTRRYELNDWTWKTNGIRSSFSVSNKDSKTYQGYFVYPNDAEDLKSHEWFDGVPWDSLHLRKPPFIPRVKNWEDTKYFDEEEVVSDIDSADSDKLCEQSYEHNVDCRSTHPGASGKACRSSHHQPEAQHIIPSIALQPGQDLQIISHQAKEVSTVDEIRNSSRTLISPRSQIERMALHEPKAQNTLQPQAATDTAREKMEPKKTKEIKRPRDKILRDQKYAEAALRVRKEGAFLGYEYRRMQTVHEIIQEVMDEKLPISVRAQRSCMFEERDAVEKDIQSVERVLLTT